MPLAPGSSPSVISSNIRELTEHGARPRSHAQIVAIALSNADKHPHKAFGGGIGHFSAMHAPKMPHGIGHMHFADGGAAIPDVPFDGGFIHSSLGGRTDRIPMSVKSDSHVWPADSVSSAGQGNSLAGAKILQEAMRSGPYGVPVPSVVHGHGPPTAPHLPSSMTGLAQGGHARRTSVLVAGGELVTPPEEVEALGQRAIAAGMAKKGESAMDAGHRLIDETIKRIREYDIAWKQKAPAPKK